MTDIPTFDTYDDPVPDPKPFRLGGRTVLTDEHWTEEFRIVGTMPQGPMTDLANSLDIKDGKILYRTPAVVRFLRAVIIPGDMARFDALIEDKDRPVTVDQLGEVMFWAAGIETARPTGPLSDSGPGQRDTETGSEDAGSSPDIDPEPSPA